MTNYERAEQALKRNIPDMIPIFELVIDPGVINGISPGCSYSDFVDMYDFDIVLTGTPSLNYRKEMLDKKTGIFRDEWGVVRRYSDQTVPFPVEGPIKDEKDLDRYVPPDPLDPFRYTGLEEIVKRFKGKKMVGMHVHDAFSYPTYLRGMDNLLMDTIERPGFVHRLVRIGVEHTVSLIKKAAELGSELFVFGDDYAGNSGPMMSPECFQEFFLPGLKKVVLAAKSAGAFTIKHTDGDIKKIIEMLISTGIDGLHPLDPEAGMNIREVKKKYGHQICVIGNIDTGKILTDSSPEKVAETVKTTISGAAPGGGYIISSSNSIHSHVKPENYVAMLESARKYGKY
jgi:uroporphyrinogen decarboxylase